MKDTKELIGLVLPPPDYIRSSGRWRWPLNPPHDNDGKCPYVVTASREWWEYAPKAALPYPDCQAEQMGDGTWIWTRPVSTIDGEQ